MSLTFFTAPMSTASITEAIIAELGVPCERVTLAIGTGETSRPDFLKLNPNGRVPVIVHDGTSIWESAAITMYLGEVFGVDKGLYSAPGPRRGEAMKWIVWGNVTLGAAAGRLAASLPIGSAGAVEAGSRDVASPDGRGDAALKDARAEVAACLRILDGGLADKPFLLGDYTLADTHVQGIVGWIGMMGTDMQPFPSVASWLARCAERPALAGMMSG